MRVSSALLWRKTSRTAPIEIGKNYGPWKYPLQDRIARYLEAVENQHPWHHGRSPWGPPVAPPTVIGNAALRFIDSIAAAPAATLHVKQSIETSAALRLDRQPQAYGHFSEKYERRGRRLGHVCRALA